jgi:hypothetical protein
MKKLLFFITFAAALLCGIAVWKILQNRAVAKPEKLEVVKIVENFEEPKIEITADSKKEVSFENVSFTYDTSLFADAKGEIVLASKQGYPFDKPDGVYSKHINFIFVKPYTGEQTSGEDYYSSPGIRVFPIEEYKKAYSFYGINLKSGFDDLKGITAKSSKIPPGSGEKQMPYIPFADAHQAFYSNAKVLNFQNGKGLLFLTQWNQDDNIINQTGLEYIFQGVSKDNKYFVFMAFPITREDLPKDVYGKYPDKYNELNDDSQFFSKKYKQLYAKYALETALKLDKMPPESFSPNLNKIESLIRSLKIK